MVVAIPPIRERFGYQPAEMVPTTYPRMRYLIFNLVLFHN